MQGSCLCGQVTYQITGPARSVVGCHCSQCRKSSGHYVAATQVAAADLRIVGQGALTWFASSDDAERGFCKTCGSPLFWRRFGSANISVMAGSLDGVTGLVMDRQLYLNDKGDYYVAPAVETIDQGQLKR